MWFVTIKNQPGSPNSWRCKTLISVYSNSSTWNEFLRCIETGEQSWLAVAVSLQPYTDAGASEGLNNAVGEALGNNPEEVFHAAIPTFELVVICSGPDVDDPRFDSYTLSIKEIDKRIDALKNIHGIGLKQKAEKCEQYLKVSKTDIARFYSVTPP